MGLWLSAALMVVMALALLLPPLLRTQSKRAPAVDRQQLNINIYRSRLKELELAFNEGELDNDDYQATRADLERAMITDVPVEQATQITDGSTHPLTAVLLAVAVPAAALGLYLTLGTPQALSPSIEGTQILAGENTGNAQQLPSVESMLASLQSRLETNPEDAKGWRLLGRTYAHLERLEEASKAYAQALVLQPGNADAMIDHAEILGRLAGDRLQGQALELIHRALSVAPLHKRALWLAGFGALQTGDNANAISYWEKLQTQGGLEPQEVEIVSRLLARARGEMAPAPSIPPSSPGTSDIHIKVRVEIAPELKAQTTPTDTVFIYARAAEGPRIPLAIVRKQVRDLPLTAELNDAMAMSPEFRLSLFPEVIINARVSKSGDARPGSGDLLGTSARLQTADQNEVAITINKRLP